MSSYLVPASLGRLRSLGVGLLLCTLCHALVLYAQEAAPSAERGYRWLLEKPYLTPDFDQATFDRVWTKWPEPLRTQAERATPEERRKLAFSRYGLTPRPEDPTKPLQYVVSETGVWTMNCFACHGGQVAGQTIPGLPNSRYALATLSEEIRRVKVDTSKPLTRMDLANVFIPLGTTNGTTNAVNFGVALLSLRDKDLNLLPSALPPPMLHHDMEPPPWWHYRRKQQIYADGFTQKSPRGLMQFTLIRSNGPEKFREWEADYQDIYAYLESLTPPEYPYEIDQALAAQGEAAFNRVCADCHGNYRTGTYPERTIPIDTLGTDRARFDALTPAHRSAFGETWFAHYGEKKTVADPVGYVAPPLDGVWASAPYFHNGSVPTLWHVLHPEERPALWQRTETGYDTERVGLEVTILKELPAKLTASQRRTYFDTKPKGKSAEGHLFPNDLTAAERRAVLEYLKTL